jgi:hypothetical protein
MLPTVVPINVIAQQPANESKSEYRNPKQTPTNKSQIGKIQNTESEGSLFGILPILVI